MLFIQKSLKIRNSIAVTVMVLASIAIVSTMAVLMMRKAAENEALQLARQTALTAAGTVSETLDVASDLARSNALAFRTIVDDGVTDRNIHNNLLRNTLKARPDLLGVAAVWEPDALDGRDADFRNASAHDASGRFVPYWYRSDGQIKTEVLVDYDKKGPGDYYQLVLQDGQEHVIEPYVYPVGGVDMLITTMSAPIIRNGSVVGGTMVDMGLGSLAAKLNEIRPMDAGWVSLVSADGLLIATPETGLLGTKATEAGISDEALNAIQTGQVEIIQGAVAANGEALLRVAVPFEVGQTGQNWLIVTDVPVSAAMANVNATITNLTFVALIIGAISGAIAFVFSGLMTKPVIALTGVMNRLAQDDLDVKVPYTDHKDEIGQMAKATGVFLENARIRRAHEAQQKEADAEAQARAARRLAMNTLADEFQSSISDVANSVSAAAKALQENAGNLTGLSKDSHDTTNGAAQASQHAQNAIQSVASAAEEMSAAIAEMTRQVTRSSEVAGVGAELAQQADSRMQGLASAAEEIGQVLSLISDIAAQTNLLALNATIEAARAGEAGKGFAVVASEVKILATQTARATEQISSNITTIQGETHNAVEAIREVRAKIDEINEATNMIASSAEEQTAATREIASSAQNAAESAIHVNNSVQQISETARQVGQMASGMRDSVSNLNMQSGNLQESVGGFIERIRSA